MASVTQLQKEFIEYTTSLYNEGYINNQFTELHKMQVEDKSDPNFMVELVSVYLENSIELLNNLTTALQQKTVDYNQVAFHAHALKGTSSNVGAQRVRSVCILFLQCCEEKHFDKCLWCLQQVNHEYILFRNKFEAFYRLEQQILQADGSIPMMETFSG